MIFLTALMSNDKYLQLGPIAIDMTITIGDIAAVITVMTVIIGGLFAYHKWKNEKNLKRSEFINDLICKLNDDEKIVKCLNMIEYSQTWYNFSFHESGELEEDFDKTFTFFSYICYLINQKFISKKEHESLKYYIQKMATNSQVWDYFYNVYHYTKYRGYSFPFPHLLDYCKKHKYIPAGFYDKDAWKKYLSNDDVIADFLDDDDDDSNKKVKFHHYLFFSDDDINYEKDLITEILQLSQEEIDKAYEKGIIESRFEAEKRVKAIIENREKIAMDKARYKRRDETVREVIENIKNKSGSAPEKANANTQKTKRGKKKRK